MASAAPAKVLGGEAGAEALTLALTREAGPEYESQELMPAASLFSVSPAIVTGALGDLVIKDDLVLP